MYLMHIVGSLQIRDSLFIVFLACDYTGGANSSCGREQEGCCCVIGVGKSHI